MLLKRLVLRNIRTYENWEVALPRGSILFEGGIGSGKSTLLLAIEFALFGLGNEKGTTLLSIGKNRGEVELDIEASGRDVRLHRSLVRSRKGGVNQGALVPAGVKQDECWLEYDGRRFTYSPKEMKELFILSLRESQKAFANSTVTISEVQLTARVKYKLGKEERVVHMIKEAEGWKIATDL